MHQDEGEKVSRLSVIQYLLEVPRFHWNTVYLNFSITLPQSGEGHPCLGKYSECHRAGTYQHWNADDEVRLE